MFCHKQNFLSDKKASVTKPSLCPRQRFLSPKKFIKKKFYNMNMQTKKYRNLIYKYKERSSPKRKCVKKIKIIYRH